MKNTIIENQTAYENAIQRRIKENAHKTRLAKFKEEHEDWEALVDFIVANENNEFWRSILDQWLEWGNLRPKVVEIIRERIVSDAKRKAEFAKRDARSQHLGEVGSKITVEATVVFQTGFYGDYGVVFITGFRTDDDNVIIHKGTPPKVGDERVAKGDRVRLTATVKEHGEREGVKQTIVTRPKAVKI